MSFPFPIFPVGCTAITETLDPDGTIQSSGWTFTEGTLHASVDNIGDDTSHAQSDVSGFSDVCPNTSGFVDFEVSLDNPVGTPADGDCQLMQIVWRAGDETDDAEILGCVDWLIQLMEGGTQRAVDDSQSDIGSSTTFTKNLTVSQVNAIGDHTNLRIRVSVDTGLEDAMAKVAPSSFVSAVELRYLER